MIEPILILSLVGMVWADVLTTYLCYRKVRDLGYPNWVEEDTSVHYRYYVRKYGLNTGILAAAFVNPLIFIILAVLLSRSLSTMFDPQVSLGLGYGVFYGMIFISVVRNYFYLKCSANEYNEKLLGKPCNHK